MRGHHAVVGAVGGCVVGRHLAKKHAGTGRRAPNATSSMKHRAVSLPVGPAVRCPTEQLAGGSAQVVDSAPAATVAAFFANVFFATTFLVAAFFAPAPLAAEYFGLLALLATPAPVATASAPAIRNFERSFAAASHAGVGPRPLHVAPVLESRYFAGCGPLRCPM